MSKKNSIIVWVGTQLPKEVKVSEKEVREVFKSMGYVLKETVNIAKSIEIDLTSDDVVIHTKAEEIRLENEALQEKLFCLFLGCKE